MQFEEQIPSPSRLVESLRDTGYSYEAAFADIVDNSIAANANRVEIDIEEDFMGNEVTVAFYDNGDGMSETELKNAMKYGSEKRSSPKSLGKFGMGLKTASTAFCRRLTVISIKNKEANARTWDVDKIIEEDSWLLIEPDLKDFSKQYNKLKEFCENSGTVVIWSKVDRLLTNSGTDFINKATDTIIKDLKQHLSAVFGKFLIGIDNFDNTKSDTYSKPDVELYINSKRLKGWNPSGFHLNDHKTDNKVLRDARVQKVIKKGREFDYKITGYVLPRKQNLSSEEEEDLRFTNYNQGFYIYRENRLVFGGGWPHRLFSQDPHLNLLRVVLDFDHNLDDYFEIDIRKSKINFPVKMREELKKLLGPWKNEANRRYRGEQNIVDPNNEKKVDHSQASKAIERTVVDLEKNKIIRIGDGGQSVILKNKFGEIEVQLHKYDPSSLVYVVGASQLEGGLLWDYKSDEEGNTIVILNQNHEFYKRFYEQANSVMVQAMDSVFWSLANSGIKSNSDLAKKNLEEMRFVVSENLSFLAKELPE